MFLCAVVLWATCLLAFPAAETPSQQDALARIQQAVAKTNIFELPSFFLKANVEIESRGQLVDGTYQMLWNGPDQWREELFLPGFGEIQIGGKGTIWIKRSTDFLPLRIYNLYAALGFSSGSEGVGALHSGSWVQFDLAPKDKIGKAHERKRHGEKLTCTQVENEFRTSSEICVNDTTGTLVRDSDYADKDFQAAGTKLYPRFLGFLEEGKTVAQVTVTELRTPAQFPADAFAPLAGVSARPGCMNPKPPRLVKRRNPEYPESARRRRIQGTVAADVLIGTDGIPRVHKVVESPSPDLEKANLEAIEGWRYTPGLCQGEPVEIETVLQVKFSLSH